MIQDKVNAFVDRTIGSLCHNAVDVDFIIKRLRETSQKYFEMLQRDDSSQTKKNYLAWYIIYADKRVEDLKSAQRIGQKIGKSRPDQIFRLIQLKEKLNHVVNDSVEKVVQFD